MSQTWCGCHLCFNVLLVFCGDFRASQDNELTASFAGNGGLWFTSLCYMVTQCQSYNYLVPLPRSRPCLTARVTHSYRQPPRLTPLVHFVVRNLTVATRVVAPASTRRRWCGSGHWREGKGLVRRVRVSSSCTVAVESWLGLLPH